MTATKKTEKKSVWKLAAAVPTAGNGINQAARKISEREAMDRLFDDAFTRPLSLNDGWSAPAIDMYQTDNDVVVKAALPGFKAEAVQINVTGEVLTIRGEMKREEEQKEKAWHTPALRAGASVGYASPFGHAFARS